ncbi:unnamed protein product [Polarella glacialis]|uniref:GAF domain-containing protein n=1 Tax=Polarella glacialis TaxID=89957 RepID=A0A813HL03_POLGL|nr:unnamed protein product [Polarella glacialis]CAE8692998.1 unnamed protein product [Polarella glacialis]
MPGDSESAVVKPLPGGGFLVLWSALPRAFDRAADRQWVSNAAANLGAMLCAEGQQPAVISSERCFEDSLPLLGGDVSEDAASRDPFLRYAQQVRIAPAIAGFTSLGGLSWNRTVLMNTLGASIIGIDPAQTRADGIGVVLAMTLVSQGMVWLSEIPANPEIEDTSEWTDSEKVLVVAEDAIGQRAADELRWVWSSLGKCTRISSMAVFWNDACVMQGGLFRKQDEGGVAPYVGEFCREVMTTGKGRYLAQLKNYPAKLQFLDFLPEMTQGLVLTPLRQARDAPAVGILVLGVDSVRGVGKVDQAWIGAIAEKLAVSINDGISQPALA